MLDTAKAARVYIKIKAERERLAAEFDAADATLKEKQEMIKTAFLAFLNESGQKSFNTGEGLVYWEDEVIPTAADWGAVYAWIKENDAFDFLHKRITAAEVVAYMERNDGAIPPGMSIFRRRVVKVRRS